MRPEAASADRPPDRDPQGRLGREAPCPAPGPATAPEPSPATPSPSRRRGRHRGDHRRRRGAAGAPHQARPQPRAQRVRQRHRRPALHHAHVVMTADDSIRLTQATAGKGGDATDQLNCGQNTWPWCAPCLARSACWLGATPHVASQAPPVLGPLITTARDQASRPRET